MLLTSYMTDFNKCLENIDFQLNSNALQAPKREKSIMKFIFYDLFTIFRKLLNELTLSFLLTKAFWRFGDLCQAHFQSFFDIDVTDLFVFSISEKRKSEVEQCQIIFQSSYQDCLILFCNSWIVLLVLRKDATHIKTLSKYQRIFFRNFMKLKVKWQSIFNQKQLVL